MGPGRQWNRSIQVTGQALQRLSAQANPLCKSKALNPEASSNLFCFRKEISCDPVSYISSYYLWLIVVIIQPLCESYVASATWKSSQKAFQYLLCKSKRKTLNYVLFDIRKCSSLSVEICYTDLMQGRFFKSNFVRCCWTYVPEKWLSIRTISNICACHCPPCMRPRSYVLTRYVVFLVQYKHWVFTFFSLTCFRNYIRKTCIYFRFQLCICLLQCNFKGTQCIPLDRKQISIELRTK